MKSAKGPVTDPEQAGACGKEGEFTAGRQVSHREFLKIAGVVGAAVGLGGGLAGALAACGTSEETTTTTAAATSTTAAPATTSSLAETTTSVTAGPEEGRLVKMSDELEAPHHSRQRFCVAY